ncbi:glycosyltransferase family 2 protein [Winogradskyella psychrotolerans]|uniref:glycosyltransferase family 2 protein n=1 Tax=Winogradskyella psychrotolerans TaxID=1344585 RepID=UPI001C074AFE|nr:glycosyltransferase family A protein [Winogradskyella psychrotolerans]MBU2929542.1 glycosyltransferase family 2 protein [Winogradskyella psychrotolerans]
MPFQFLRYLQPTHYFRLFTAKGGSVFPKASALETNVLEQLAEDSGFQSAKAKAYDMSWQATQKGYIGSAAMYTCFEPVPLADEYRFIRKYFNKAWVLYVLLIRLLSFKNPITELKAYYVTRAVKRSTYLETPINHKEWFNFKSSLVIEQPKVSVIIPTLNRYTYLKDVLRDLELQDYTNFEVIIVDQSEPFQRQFYKGFQLDLHVLYQKERALWLARNTAIKKAKGNFLLLFDDDSRVDTDWITNHLKCLDYFNADMSSGVSISKVGAEVPSNYNFFRVSDQLDTGNVLIKREVFEEIGLFDRQFEKQRMGDGEFGLRSYLNGYLNISNPYAKRLHLKVGSGGLRDMGSWDAFRTNNWFAPRPIPSVLYLFRRYFGNKASRFALFRTVPISIMPYQFKKNKPLLILGVFVSLLLVPLVLFQVLKSWKLASNKLEEGALIEKLGVRDELLSI